MLVGAVKRFSRRLSLAPHPRHPPHTHTHTHTHTLFRTLAPSHLCSWSLILASGFNFKKSWIKDIWGSFLGFPAGSRVKNLPAMQEMQETPVQSQRQEDPLEEGMATHFNILAWRTPWTEEPSELWSIGSQRVEHDWSIWTQKAHTGIISNFTLNMRFVRNESKELGVWKKGGGIQPVMIYWAFITRGQKWNETEISAIWSLPFRVRWGRGKEED